MWRVHWGGGVNHLRQSGLSGALWGARDAGGPAVASGGELGEQQQPADYAWRFQTPEGIRQIAIPGKLVLDNSEVFTAAGLAGLGMLQGMRFFLQPYIDSGQLVEVLPDFPAPRRPLSLLYPHRHLSHKVRVFADWLQGLVATTD